MEHAQLSEADSGGGALGPTGSPTRALREQAAPAPTALSTMLAQR